MKNADKPAYPVPSMSLVDGLTKREMFAMAAMQGILASTWGRRNSGEGKCELLLDQIIPASIKCADALLKALEQ